MCLISTFSHRPSVNVTFLTLGLTIGAKVGTDPAKDIVKAAFENGINMFDTAEGYGHGGAEFELWVTPLFSRDTGIEY